MHLQMVRILDLLSILCLFIYFQLINSSVLNRDLSPSTNQYEITYPFRNLDLIPDSLASSSSSTASEFWTQSEIRNIRWKSGCMTSRLCPEARLVLATSASPTASTTAFSPMEKITAEWDLARVTSSMGSSIRNTKDHPLQLTASWRSDRLTVHKISVQVYLIGVDARFRFPRVCDETRDVFVFESLPEPTIFEESSQHDKTSGGFDSETVLSLSGECFEASVGVRYFRKHCPWCSSASETASKKLNTRDENLPKNNPEKDTSKDGLFNWIKSFSQREDSSPPMDPNFMLSLLILLILFNVVAGPPLLFFCIRECCCVVRRRNRKKDDASILTDNTNTNSSSGSVMSNSNSYSSGVSVPLPTNRSSRMISFELPPASLGVYRSGEEDRSTLEQNQYTANIDKHYDVISERSLGRQSFRLPSQPSHFLAQIPSSNDLSYVPKPARRCRSDHQLGIPASFESNNNFYRNGGSIAPPSPQQRVSLPQSNGQCDACFSRINPTTTSPDTERCMCRCSPISSMSSRGGSDEILGFAV